MVYRHPPPQKKTHPKAKNPTKQRKPQKQTQQTLYGALYYYIFFFKSNCFVQIHLHVLVDIIEVYRSAIN